MKSLFRISKPQAKRQALTPELDMSHGFFADI